VAANVRLNSLHDLIRRKANLRVECGKCQRIAIMDAYRFARFCQIRGWNTQLSTLYARLRCSSCGSRPVHLSAYPGSAGPDPFPMNEDAWKHLFKRRRG
jgi:hypothetical protein